ncbi:MAG: 2-dehydropantoate 2-reductase [Rubrivivax sp.]|nr:2-dehydropantoate 2-reductase [Rubrivivax sp.]
MRVLILGSGGVGGYFGAQLAKAGHEVFFVARGAHLQALQTRGLRVDSPLSPVQLQPVHAGSDPASIDQPDIVLFCPKLWDVKSAAAQLAPALGPHSLVIPLQNGVESHVWLAEIISAVRLGRADGRAQVGIGVAQISSTIGEPGVIHHSGSFARLRVGLPPRLAADAVLSARLDAFVTAAAAAGIDIQRVPDALHALWEKYVFLVAMSGLTSLVRLPIGPIRSDPDLRATLEASMHETAALAATQGVHFESDFIERQMAFVDGLHADMRSSMLRDLLAGRRLEAPWLCGGVARMAGELGLPCPVNRTLYAALKPWIDGAPA